jgi:hypothetical protein
MRHHVDPGELVAGRPLWIAGSVVRARQLTVENAALRARQARHDLSAHLVCDGAPAAVGADLRSNDGTIALSMPPLESVPLSCKAAPRLRQWTISAARELVSLGWGAGGKILMRLRGALASTALKCGGIKLGKAVATPDSPRPFRLFRRAADRKAEQPEALVFELAAPADPELAKTSPLPGMQIGAVEAHGFVPLLEIRPGRGVVMRGTCRAVRKIVRSPPPQAPSDAELTAAFLRTDAGKAARAVIEEKASKIVPSLTIPGKRPAEGAVVDLTWGVTNGTTMQLKNLRALAAFTPPDADAAPVWTELPPPRTVAGDKPTTTLEVGQEVAGKGALVVPKVGNEVRLLLVMEADYAVPLTRLEKQSFPP